MKELQILQNKAAKLILDTPLHSSSTDASTVLSWLNLEERRKCHRCIYAYKCINGQLEHSLDIIRTSDVHSHNTRNKDTINLPKIKYNWGKHRSRYHCFKDFNELERTARTSASLPRRSVFFLLFIINFFIFIFIFSKLVVYILYIFRF